MNSSSDLIEEQQPEFVFPNPEIIASSHDLGNPPIVSGPELNLPTQKPNHNERICHAEPQLPSNSRIEDNERRRKDFSRYVKETATVELQVETMTSNTTRVFLVSWYVVLIVSLVIQTYVGFQWSMRNFCDAESCSFTNFSMWNSSLCLKSLIECVPEDSEIRALESAQDSSLTVSSSIKLNETIPRRNSSKRRKMCFRTKQMTFVKSDTYVKHKDKDSTSSQNNRLFKDSPADTTRDIKEASPTHPNRDLRGVQFSSSAITTMNTTIAGLRCPPNAREVYYLRWEGINFGSLANVKLNRFAHLVLSLASPMARITPLGSKHRTYQLLVLLEEMLSYNTTLPLVLLSNSSQRYVYRTFVTCHFDESRCATVVVPPSVALPTSNSTYTLTLLDVDAELGDAAVSDSFVGLIYQRGIYTMATMIWRYGGIIFTLLLMVRFLSHSWHSSMLYEQYCVLFLQFGLILYLNPLFGFGIYTTGKLKGWLNFFEFHIPTYFVALLFCFMFAVFAATVDWGAARHDSDRDEEEEGCTEGFEGGSEPNRVSHRGKHEPIRNPISCDTTEALATAAGAPLLHSVGGAHVPPPISVSLGLLAYFTLVVCLDIAKAFQEDWSWGTESFCTTHVCLFLRHAMHAVLLVGFLLTGVAFFWMKRNLSRRSYLESRPQQLAGRIIIFLFSSSLVYIFVQAYLVYLLYPQILTMAYYRPLLQLSPLTVSIFFVNHMTFVYTTTRTSRRVPIRPDDPEWKRIMWPKRWFHWLQCHGGSRYIFFSEAEERRFFEIQDEARRSSTTDSIREVSRRLVPHHHYHHHRGSGVLPRQEHQNDDVDLPSETSGLLMDNADEENCDAKSRCFHSAACFAAGNASLTRSHVNLSKSSSNYNMEDDQDAASAGSNDNSTEVSFREVDPHLLPMGMRKGGEFVGSTPSFMGGRVLDRPLQVLLRAGQRHQRRATHHRYYFFNLETAIDCFNISWEAYAVVEGGDELRTVELSPSGAIPSSTERIARRVLTYFFDWRSASSATAEVVGRPQSEAVAALSVSPQASHTPAPEILGGSETDKISNRAGAALCHRSTSPSTLALPATGLCSPPPSPSPSQDHVNSLLKQSITTNSPDTERYALNGGSPAAGVDSCSTTAKALHPQVMMRNARTFCPERFGYKRLAVIEVREMQVIITQLDTTLAHHTGKVPRIMVAFRGTHNVMNALHNLKMRKRVWKEMETGALMSNPRARVHSGILELWMSLKERVLGTVLMALGRVHQGNYSTLHEDNHGSGAKSPSRASSFGSSVPIDTNWPYPLPGTKKYYAIYTTGHSLGGALACLCAYSLHRALSLVHYPNTDITVYTFGQPRFTNRAFQRVYNRAVPCTFRVVNEDDVVSYFNVFSGHHVGIEVDIDRRGNYVCRPTMVERTFRPTSGMGFAVQHHTMEAYMSSLNAIAERHAPAACSVRCIASYVYPIPNGDKRSSDERKGFEGNITGGILPLSGIKDGDV
ncbi:unnamed protein product [Phytomonas sp. EM1]|nr:unnamed protein product [Phytomonas sp. EM1]|eukprot:CCW59638.1 unnamed protein product [Phytomonas sp. isolate EM1]